MSLKPFGDRHISEVLSDNRVIRFVQRRVLGDPSTAPFRLAKLIVALLLGVVVVGLWALLTADLDSSGSSYWAVSHSIQILKSPWILPILLLYVYYRYIGLLRSREAARAAEKTGWLAKTVEQLADEMRSTDYTNRVIATTSHTREEIEQNVRRALHDQSHPAESVDFWGRNDLPARTDGGEPSDDAGAPDDSDAPNDKDDALDDSDAFTVDDILGDDSDSPPGDVESDDAESDDVDEGADAMDDDPFDSLWNDDLDDILDEDDDEAEIGTSTTPEDDSFAPDEDPDDEGSLEERSADLPWSDNGTDESDADPPWSNDRSNDRSNDSTDESDAADAGSVDADDTDADDGSEAEGTSRLGRAKALLSGPFRAVFSGAVTVLGYARLVLSLALSVLLVPVRLVTSRFGSDQTEQDDTPREDPFESDVPWRVRFIEEMKHLSLDVMASIRAGDILWKFVLPAAVAFVLQVILVRIWTTGWAYLVFALNAAAFGLLVFWAIKRRRSRRLRAYRTESTDDYWNDAAGRVKMVETPDVTAYMGFIGGKRYASYDEEEFVEEFSKRLYQRVNGETVAPSVLEIYARNLAQMKPNLEGHLINIELPLIQSHIKEFVEGAEDEMLPKAELAYRVIEEPPTHWFEPTLGHDPALVGEAYRWMVEEGHALAETTIENPDASGETTEVTWVYPTSKRRLPEVSQLHTRYSDRFTDLHGEPLYELPEVDPTDDLSGFTPTPESVRQIPKPALPSAAASRSD